MPAGVKNPYGLKDNILTHVSDVPSGLKCDCVCPACQSPLVAKKGSKNVHHFTHHKSPECGAGLETTLHLIAKEILAGANEITLPPVKLGLGTGSG